jgi:ethanolamine ammonia-lyase large subunit
VTPNLPPTQSTTQSTIQPIEVVQPLPPTNTQLSSAIIPGLDFSNISQSIIDQVRNEYLTTKKEEEKLKKATSITPEVLVKIGNMVKETDLIQVLKKCKERQDKKERELFSHRESIKERYKKRKEVVLAK